MKSYINTRRGIILNIYLRNRIWGVEPVMGWAQERSLSTQILTFGWRRKNEFIGRLRVNLWTLSIGPHIHTLTWWLKQKLISKRDAFHHDEMLKNVHHRLPFARVCVTLIYKCTFLHLIFCWPCIIMYHSNLTNLIHFHFHYHNHFIVS
jgi:hypothetical protein